MTAAPLDPQAFRAALNRGLGRALRPGERLAVAVSGGADSLALLLLAHGALDGQVAAVTVDHGLRVASADEAHGVSAIATDLGVPHAVLVLRMEGGGNVQARARDARYRAMAQWCVGEGIGLLATAHHADDQAETLLMRLARGSGGGGLQGIRPLLPFDDGAVRLVRPLLDWRKAELARLAAAAGLVAVDDPSNRDARFDRTRARALLADNDWLDTDNIAAAARHLASEAEALDWAAALAWRSRAEREEGGWSLDMAALPDALRHRLVVKAVAAITGGTPRGAAVAGLIARLEEGGSFELAGVLVRPGPRWRFGVAPPRR